MRRKTSNCGISHGDLEYSDLRGKVIELKSTVMSETTFPLGDLMFAHTIINSVWVRAGGIILYPWRHGNLPCLLRV